MADQEEMKLVTKALAENDLVVSLSEGRRLIQQGAIKLDGEIVGSTIAEVRPGTHRISIGKHKSKTIVV